MKIVLEERRGIMNREEYMNKVGNLEYEMNIINDLEYGNFNMGREPGTSTTINTPILSIYCC